MGQRTAFLIKRTYWDGSVNIRLVHHQWGIGRVMHFNFMKSVLELETNRDYERPLNSFMTIFDDKYSLYCERTFKKGARYIPDNVLPSEYSHKSLNEIRADLKECLEVIGKNLSESNKYIKDVDSFWKTLSYDDFVSSAYRCKKLLSTAKEDVCFKFVLC